MSDPIDPKQSASKLINMTAAPDGWKPRTVRLEDGKYALCTSTYNYSQSEDTKHEIARRISALWNLAHGISTERLEALANSGVKLLKTSN